jgi:hypothetical protein
MQARVKLETCKKEEKLARSKEGKIAYGECMATRVDWKVVVEEYRLALKEGDYGRGPRGN